MKQEIKQLLHHALRSLACRGVFSVMPHVDIQVVRTKRAEQGDFSTNLAFKVASMCDRHPFAVASLLVDALPKSDSVISVEIAVSGFINFRVCSFVPTQVMASILQNGLSTVDHGSKSMIQHRDMEEKHRRALCRIDEMYHRTENVLCQMQTYGLSSTEDKIIGLRALDALILPHETRLIEGINGYVACMSERERGYDLPKLIDHLVDLAENMHRYYNAVSLLDEQTSLRCARLCLLTALYQVLYNGMQQLRASISEITNG